MTPSSWWFFAGPGLWVLSQMLLVLYFWLDNGANTCGIDFHFKKSNQICTCHCHENQIHNLAEVEVNENEESIPLNSRSNSSSRVETGCAPEESSSVDDSRSIVNDDEPRGNYFFELKVLEKLCICKSSKVSKLFIREFKVVSEEGRWDQNNFHHFSDITMTSKTFQYFWIIQFVCKVVWPTVWRWEPGGGFHWGKCMYGCSLWSMGANPL